MFIETQELLWLDHCSVVVAMTVAYLATGQSLLFLGPRASRPHTLAHRLLPVKVPSNDSHNSCAWAITL
jgi:hypothetical protein